MTQIRTAILAASLATLMLAAGTHQALAATHDFKLEPAPTARKKDLLGKRTPLILIHGFCGNNNTWAHARGFREYFESSQALKRLYKLYYFSYSTALTSSVFENSDATQEFQSICGDADGESLHDSARIQTLAVHLRTAISGRREFRGGTPIAFVTHSLGGMIARSFMQELQGHERTNLLITLATPHHGTSLAAVVDRSSGLLSSLYWDGYDGVGTASPNLWLKCLNGLEPNNGFCSGSDTPTITQTLAKTVAIGVFYLFDPVYPDDGAVPLQSSLFIESPAALQARYVGRWWPPIDNVVSLPGICYGQGLGHSTIHHDGCFAAGYPSASFDIEAIRLAIRADLTEPRRVFSIIEQELIDAAR